MPRRKLIAITAAAVVGASIALAAYAHTRAPSDSETPSGQSADARSAGQTTGQHGGSLLASGDVAIEVLLSEKPDDTRLVVYPYVNGKPVEAGALISGTMTRIDGTTENLQFVVSGNRFTSMQAIAKPHVFDDALSDFHNNGMLEQLAHHTGLHCRPVGDCLHIDFSVSTADATLGAPETGQLSLGVPSASTLWTVSKADHDLRRQPEMVAD